MQDQYMKDNKPIRLRWYDPINQQFIKAGVGFYNGSFGDYTLKLNMNRGKVYLRPCSFEDNQTQYRVEEVKHENGKVIKETVGVAYSDESTKDTIHIKLGGFSDILILG